MDASSAGPRFPSVRSRFPGAASRLGRLCITLGVVVAATWIVGPNLPDGPFRERVEPIWAPATEIGLVQDWGVFSPDPRDQSLDVRALIDFSDGTGTTWDVPDFDPALGALRQYRWNKWQERIRLDSSSASWDRTARWIAGRIEVEAGARDVVRVTLVRRWIDHEPLGSGDGPLDSGWNEYAFHVWEPGS